MHCTHTTSPFVWTIACLRHVGFWQIAHCWIAVAPQGIGGPEGGGTVQRTPAMAYGSQRCAHRADVSWRMTQSSMSSAGTWADESPAGRRRPNISAKI